MCKLLILTNQVFARIFLSVINHLWGTLDLFFLIVLIAISLKLKTVHNEADLKSFNIENTTPLRGMLMLAVVICHMAIYFPLFSYTSALTYTGPVSVAVFFFLSGYGLMKSYLRKGPSYLNGFLQHRLVKILPLCATLTTLNFLLRMGWNHDSFYYMLTGFKYTRWLNFSWFIYAIIYIYISYWLSVKYSNSTQAVLIRFACAVLIYIGIIHILEFPDYWNGTIISTLSGFVVAQYEPSIRHWIINHRLLTAVSLFVSWGLLKMIMHFSFPDILYPYVGAIFNESNWFAFVVLLAVYTLGMISNSILRFFGKITLEIYLFHGFFTQVAFNLHIKNFGLACFFVLGLSIISSLIMWNLLQRVKTIR
jgi:peptidoglycan/LPS O-acetylase OafA/YrhL